MSVFICPNCQKETEVLPPYYRCAYCQATLYDESINKNNEQNTLNQVVVPEGLHNNLIERPSIKHKITLKKEALPWEKEAQTKEISQEIPLDTPISIPVTQEAISIQEEKQPIIENVPQAQNEDLENLMDLFAEAKKDNIQSTENKETVVETSLDVSFDDLNISKDGKELTTKKETPKAETPQIPIQNPIEKPKSPDDLIMWDVMSEIEERDKKLSQFLTNEQDEKVKVNPTYFSQPPIPKISNRLEEKVGRKELAWLIRHTEGKEPVFYALYEGENVIGKSTTAIPTDVEISDDVYVSYGHAILRIYEVPPAIFLFELRDDGSKRPDKQASLNGTFVNGYAPKITKPVFLNDGDAIQVGLTQFVLKISSSKFPDMATIIRDALRKPYMAIVK
jgi:FHA domain